MSPVRLLLMATCFLTSIKSAAGEVVGVSLNQDIARWVNIAVHGEGSASAPMIYRPKPLVPYRSESSIVASSKGKDSDPQPLPERFLASQSSQPTSIKPQKGFFQNLKSEFVQAVEFAKEGVSDWMDEKGLGDKKRYKAIVKKQKQKEDLKQLDKKLPTYNLGGQKKVDSEIDNLRKAIKGSSSPVNLIGGQLPSIKLVNDKSNVPVLKSIPSKVSFLNIGEEPVVQRIPLPEISIKVPNKNYLRATKLGSPQMTNHQIIREMETKLIPLRMVQTVDRQKLGLPQVVTKKKIAKVVTVKKENMVEPQWKDFVPLITEELDMLAAQILNKKGLCHITAGLFDKLANSKSLSSQVQLEIGRCAYKMGLHRLAVDNLILATRGTETKEQAILELVKDFPKSFEDKIGRTFEGVDLPMKISKNGLGRFYYAQGKWAFKKDRFLAAAELMSKIPKGAKDRSEGMYLKGVAEHLAKKNKLAVKTFTELRNHLKSNPSKNKDLKILTSLTLSRIHFKRGAYKQAFNAQKGVNKNHNLWVQTMIEQGWTQLSIGDHAGAIGNMYSIHSPYFRSVYKPHSYSLRTIGYLQICQYGDAYNSLVVLEKTYRPWLRGMKGYLAGRKNKRTYYNTVAKYLRNSKTKVIDGLNASVVRDLARQKTFLNFQAGINQRVEERDQWDFLKKFIQRDMAKIRRKIQQSKSRRTKLNVQIAKAKKDNSLIKNVPIWKGYVRSEGGLIDAYEFQLTKYKEGLKQFNRLRTREAKTLVKEIGELKMAAGKFLYSHLKNMAQDLAISLENNEFLRFEIFSGSGENIRYQVSGGSTESTKRIPAHIKPEKHVNWNFDGEFWEDEIGAYRSTLKNNCPNYEKFASKAVN